MRHQPRLQLSRINYLILLKINFHNSIIRTMRKSTTPNHCQKSPLFTIKKANLRVCRTMLPDIPLMQTTFNTYLTPFIFSILVIHPHPVQIRQKITILIRSPIPNQLPSIIIQRSRMNPNLIF